MKFLKLPIKSKRIFKTASVSWVENPTGSRPSEMLGLRPNLRLLRGASIATNPFARAAWRNGNAVPSTVIRGNGFALNQSSSAALGKHRK